MNLLKYNDFLIEGLIYNLLLESKVIYSSKFLNILNKMKDNKVSKELINLYTKDIDGINHNYIDISDEKDRATFTQDRKAQEIVGKEPQTWRVNNEQRYLTHSPKNDKIFSLLEYEKPEGEPWIPSIGTLGLIKNEIVSPTSGKIYVVFEEYDDSEGNDTTPKELKKTVLNKQAIAPSESVNKVWSHARNPVNVGKLARAILKSAKVTFIDKDIEDFVNQYKATFDFLKDATKRFDIVSGKDIAKWYWHGNYVEGGGTLNNSCMAEVDDEDCFDIYVYNKQVNLVILYDDNGTINSEGKYTSNKIKGRAILWDCTMNGKKIKFMDRIYTASDSDVELFKQFAQKNDWWFKVGQNMSPGERVTDGKTTTAATLIANLDQADWDVYPYMDTMCYINTDKNTASNLDDDYDRICRDTEGGWEGYYGDEDDDY
jgi:hypothetical protein